MGPRHARPVRRDAARRQPFAGEHHQRPRLWRSPLPASGRRAPLPAGSASRSSLASSALQVSRIILTASSKLCLPPSNSDRFLLAALWVFDYRDQDGEWNVTAANSRSVPAPRYRRCQRANRARPARAYPRGEPPEGPMPDPLTENLEHTQPNSSVPARRDSGRGSRRCAEPEEPHRLGALRARPQREADVAEGGRSGPDGGPPEARIKAHRVARRFP